MPADFRRLPFERQVELLRRNIRADLQTFASECQIQIDPEPFTGERFERYLGEAGAGWWLEEDGEIFRTMR